jgi:hypothetical protein
MATYPRRHLLSTSICRGLHKDGAGTAHHEPGPILLGVEAQRGAAAL